MTYTYVATEIDAETWKEHHHVSPIGPPIEVGEDVVEDWYKYALKNAGKPFVFINSKGRAFFGVYLSKFKVV